MLPNSDVVSVSHYTLTDTTSGLDRLDRGQQSYIATTGLQSLSIPIEQPNRLANSSKLK
jgi:hypothetical protein